MSSKKFEKGKYYIGDPCYMVKEHDEWMKLLKDTNYFRNKNQIYKDKIIFVGDTAYGDGIYLDNKGHTYGVDSGSIGIMPIECISKSATYNIFAFEEDFIVTIDHGVFKFGDIIIDTVGDNEE